MRKGFKKLKFGHGRDADRALIRKLTVNFLMVGKLKTTLIRAKAVKPEIEKLVGKVKRMSEADKNYLLAKLGDLRRLKTRFADVKEALGSVTSGYTRVVKLGARDADGAEMAELTWAYPVVMSQEPKIKKDEKKIEAKTESKIVKEKDKK